MNKLSFVKGRLCLKTVNPETIQSGHLIEELNYTTAVGKYSKQKGQKPTRFMKVYEPSIELEDKTLGDIKYDELDYRFLQEIGKKYLKDGDTVTVKMTPDGQIAVNNDDKVFVRKWIEREPLPAHLVPVVKSLSGNRHAIELVKELNKREIVIMDRTTYERELVEFGINLRKNDQNSDQLHKVEDYASAFLSDREYFAEAVNLEPVLKIEEQSTEVVEEKKEQVETAEVKEVVLQ